MTTRPVVEISVGPRFRSDLGDVGDLVSSISAVGLLHPVVILSDGTLVAGARRLEACRQLGWADVPVTVADDLDSARKLLEAERDENTCRVDMKPSERVALGRKLEELERPKAAERKGGRPKTGENFTPVSGERTRDKVGPAVGWSGPTYEAAKAVVNAAESGVPGAAAAVEEMDRTGKVHGTHRRLFPRTRNGHGELKHYEAKTPRQQQLCQSAYKKLAVAIATLDGHRMGLERLDLSKVLVVANREEVEDWIATLDGIGRALAALKKNLKEGLEHEASA